MCNASGHTKQLRLTKKAEKCQKAFVEQGANVSPSVCSSEGGRKRALGSTQLSFAHRRGMSNECHRKLQRKKERKKQHGEREEAENLPRPVCLLTHPNKAKPCTCYIRLWLEKGRDGSRWQYGTRRSSSLRRHPPDRAHSARFYPIHLIGPKSPSYAIAVVLCILRALFQMVYNK